MVILINGAFNSNQQYQLINTTNIYYREQSYTLFLELFNLLILLGSYFSLIALIFRYIQTSTLKYIFSQQQMLPKNQLRIINKQYAIVDANLLGKGSTGNVFQGYQLTTNKKVAIKVIELNKIDNQVTKYLLNCEIAALKHLGPLSNASHQNIVKLLDVVQQKECVYLIMQLLEGGTLMEYIKHHPNGLPFLQAEAIFRQLLEGYQSIRGKEIIHRDLKPGNILFKNRPEINKKVAIIDFGYCELPSVPNKPNMYYNVGSPKYMSPEAYKSNLYSQKSDIWALGVIFYQMLTGRNCDYGMSMNQYLDTIEKKGIIFPQGVSSFHRFLLSGMLRYDYHLRMDCLSVLNAFKQYDQNQNKKNIYNSKENVNSQNQPNFNFFIRPTPQRDNPVFHSMIVGEQKLQFHNSRVNFHTRPNSNGIRISPNKSGFALDTKTIKVIPKVPFAVNQSYTQASQINKARINTLDFDSNSRAFSAQYRLVSQNPYIEYSPNGKIITRIIRPTQNINPAVKRNSDQLAELPYQTISLNMVQHDRNKRVQTAKMQTVHDPKTIASQIRDQRICSAPFNAPQQKQTIDLARNITKRQPNSSLNKKNNTAQNNAGNYFPNSITSNNPKALEAPIKKRPAKNKKPGLSTPIRAAFAFLHSRPTELNKVSMDCSD